jgi:hypothetical protein
VINELRVARKRKTYPEELLKAYDKTLTKIGQAIRQPIQYAGPGQWSVFPKPQKRKNLPHCVSIPGTRDAETCLVVSADLWQAFRDLSLWIEALCIHEWCLFTERLEQPDGSGIDRGLVYVLLTARPDNRRPLTWERNQIDILLMEGLEFRCPWTAHRIRSSDDYDLDHILPVSVYPINELWNLVPADPYFNSHRKRDRLPSDTTLAKAQPHLISTYSNYTYSDDLNRALREDAELRFTSISLEHLPESVTEAVLDFVASVSATRNLAQF